MSKKEKVDQVRVRDRKQKPSEGWSEDVTCDDGEHAWVGGESGCGQCHGRQGAEACATKNGTTIVCDHVTARMGESSKKSEKENEWAKEVPDIRVEEPALKRAARWRLQRKDSGETSMRGRKARCMQKRAGELMEDGGGKPLRPEARSRQAYPHKELCGMEANA